MTNLIPDQFFQQLLCPNCVAGGLELVLKQPRLSELTCSHCGSRFPVIADIPRLVDMDNYGTSFGFQWNKHRQTQLDSYSGLSLSKDRLLAATGWKTLADASGMKILEAGSGAGRFTEILVSTNSRVWSFDYSSAVDANAANNGRASNLSLFQGDIYRMPVADGSFDWVICLGVIQHTPNPKESFRSLASKVRPGGWLAIDVYTRSFKHALQWKYFLRPVTRKMNQEHLYRLLKRSLPLLLPITRVLKQLFGRFGARISPIVEYSHLGASCDLNAEWALLDSFDMYAPAHDHPQSLSTVKRWFLEADFVDIEIFYGANGVVGRGRRPPAVANRRELDVST